MTTNVKAPPKDTASRVSRSGQAITQTAQPGHAPITCTRVFGYDQAPVWCYGGHQADDHPDDRRHCSETRTVELTLEKAERQADGELYIEQIAAYLTQHDTARHPHIEVGRLDEQGITLTIDEARAFAGHLLALADLAAQGGAR